MAVVEVRSEAECRRRARVSSSVIYSAKVRRPAILPRSGLTPGPTRLWPGLHRNMTGRGCRGRRPIPRTGRSRGRVRVPSADTGAR